MTKEEDFENSIAKTLAEIKDLLLSKGKEYRRDNNPFHNFERGAVITGKSREEVLQGFLLKHIISVEDMRNDLVKGVYPSIEKVHEKYNDILVYFLIEKTMLLENVVTYTRLLDACRK